jgi:Bacterial mobilisation protein (MobC)
MNDGTHLTTWVTNEMKQRFSAVARHQGLSDSGLLKRLVEMMLQGAGAANMGPVEVAERGARDSRMTVRIRPDDQLLLRERATARGMPAATYLSVLTRAHLRGLSPLPKAEWLALEKSVSELSRLARNINQIARAANRGDRIVAPGQDYVQMMLKICTALRDNTKALLQANLKSWQQGYEEP